MTEHFSGHPKMGWLPDYPSIRDYTPNRDTVAPKLQALGQKSVKSMLGTVGATTPSLDLRATGEHQSLIREALAPAPPMRGSVWSSISSAALSASTSMRPACFSTR